MNFVEELMEAEDEPIITDEDEKIFKKITSIGKVRDFTEMNLSDEKLDSLIESLEKQEEFTSEIKTILKNLEKVSSIIMENDDEEEYI